MPSDSSKKDLNEVRAPIPRRVQQLPREMGQFGGGGDIDLTSFTPNTANSVRQHNARRPSYTTIESSRELYYNLDYPEGIEKLQLDPSSRFYSRSKPRTLDLPKLLPYQTENPTDRAKFLSHIISHLYIAIKTLDIQGSLSVTAKDLAALKDVSGLSDIDLALETNLFEYSESSQDQNPDDDVGSYFSNDEMQDSESDAENEEEQGQDTEGEPLGDGAESSNQHKKSPKSAAVVSVRTWTHELMVWLKMKYDMPITLRIKLARVYFAICLSRGQNISLKSYVKTFELLTKDVRLLKERGMILPWVDLYKELASHLTPTDPGFEAFEKKEHRQLLRLAVRASQFFEDGVLPQLYSKIGSEFSISNASLVLSSMSMLPNNFTSGGVSDNNDIRHYIASFFYLWKKLSKSVGLDEQLTSRLGVISMASLTKMNDDPAARNYMNLGSFGVFSKDQITFVVNTLINSLSINEEKYSSAKSKYFHGFASILVYSINGSCALEAGGIMDLLKTLLNAVESYVHPSNTGEWTRPIAKFVMGLVYQYHKRYSSEVEPDGTLHDIPESIKLTDEVTTEFVRILLPIIKTGIQSKKASASEFYVSSLHILGYLKPELVIEDSLLDIYESLEGVISTHRVAVALNTVEVLARFFASTPIFRVHVARLLLACVPGIDSNDVEKTINTLDVFASFSNFIPFHDLTEGDGDPAFAIQFTQEHLEYLQRRLYLDKSDQEIFEVDEETELEALKSSTSAFKSIFKSFSDRIFILLENLPDPSESEGIEKDLAESLPKFLNVVFEAMSDDIFSSFRNDFFDFVFNNTYHNVADIAAEVCGGLIKRDPSSFKKYSNILISRIKEEIEENGAGVSRTGEDIVPRDQALYWNLTILNYCVGDAGGVILGQSKKLVDLSYYLMDNVKGPVVSTSSFLVCHILQSITKIRLKENRLISPAYQEDHKVGAENWGGFQFDERRFSKENTTFDWFIPTDKEVSFAVDCFNGHVTKSLGNILKLMKDYNDDPSREANSILQLTDEITLNLLSCGYALTGVSYLLDPSFDEDIPKLGSHQTESIQNRLLLLSQIRGIKKDYASQEPCSENIQENLQKIVEDLSSEDLIEYMFDFDKLSEFKVVDNEDTTMKDAKDTPEPEFKHDSILMAQSDSPTHSIEESARATPKIEGIEMSSMNPAITFRERKLYTSSYFFGDDIEKRRSNELYLKVHKIRHLIAKSLHIICKFLTSHFHDNTSLIQHFLFVVNIWFSNVGRERLLAATHAKIKYSYVSGIQRVNKVRKPFTRIAMGARIEDYHLLRVALHATSRSQTPLDKLLLEDVVKLSVSTYSSIADAAQMFLVDVTKRVTGSYNIIIKTAFKYIIKALDEDNHKKIESGLNIFTVKKIKSKLHNDFFNIQKYIEILYRCLQVDSIEVYSLAQNLFEGVYNISPPSSVTLINMTVIDCIRPPDEFIDLEIKAVRLAKEKKRKLYFDKLSKLEETVISHERQNSHWKTSSMNLQLLINIQSDYGVDTNGEVLLVLTNEASNGHPVVSRIALKGITKLVYKLYLLQSWNYDLKNAYDLDFMSKDFKVVDTTPNNGESYYSTWRKELTSKEPSYFLDFKVSTGWLFWNTEMKAITNEPCKLTDLSEKDSKSLKEFCKIINKEWFLNIVKLWITDNEANFAFQGSDVFFTFTLVLLLSTDLVEGFVFEDLLDIVQLVYVKDEKSSHIVVCELLAGILIGSKTLTKEESVIRDDFISVFLSNILENDLSPDNRGIWNIFSWWIPSHIDCRRFPKIVEKLTNITLDQDSDSAIREATRISYIRSLVASMTWNISDPDSLLQFCIDHINHPYEAIRNQIGSLMAVLSFPYYSESVSTGAEFLVRCNEKRDLVLYNDSDNILVKLLPELFDKMEMWRRQVEHLAPQEILKSNYIYSATTILTWLRQELNTSIAVLYQKYIPTHILPFLLNLVFMKDVCLLGNIDPVTVLKKVSQIPYDSRHLDDIVLMLEKYSKQNLNLLQTFMIGEFTETFYFKNLFTLSKSQRGCIINLTNERIYHKNVEVRESAASTLSGLIHISPPDEISDLISILISSYSSSLDKARRKYKKIGYKNLSNDDIVQLHGSTLGLGALVHAFSFNSPPPKWVPAILSIIANKCSGLPGTVGKTAKDILGKFKKNRQDSWHIDSKVFSEDQIQDLEGVLWKSYII